MLEDVQTLNEWALKQKADVTKISYGVLPLVTHNYSLLNSGSAIGTGVGPLLISADASLHNNVEEQAIAIPGKNTTANLLFSLAFPAAKNKIYLRYDEIEAFVLSGKGLGVIIHENRFTYQDKGLLKVTDLGAYWEKETGNPIPLGGIIIKKKLEKEIQLDVDSLIKKSIEYAFSNYPVLNKYIRSNAQEMSEDIMRKHIDLYVNDYSLELGLKGRSAVKKLVEIYNFTNGTGVATDFFVHEYS